MPPPNKPRKRCTCCNKEPDGGQPLVPVQIQDEGDALWCAACLMKAAKFTISILGS